MFAPAYITTANVWVFSLILIGLYLVFVSFWLATFALFPGFVRECSDAWGRPVRQVAGGLVPTIVLVVGGLALANAMPQPALKLFATLLVGVPIVLGLAGSSGLALRIGRGLPRPSDDGQSWRRVLRGGSVLWLTFLLPVFGWFFIWPLVLSGGFGISLGRWRARRRARRASSVPEVPAGAGRADRTPHAPPGSLADAPAPIPPTVRPQE